MNRLNPVRENSLQDCRLMSDQTRCSDFNWRTKATNEAYKACNVVIQGGPDYVKCLDKLIYTIQEAPEDCSPGKINSAYMAECRATNKAREACAGRWNARSEYNKCIGEKRTGLINEFSKSGIKVTRAIYGGNCQNKAAPRDSLASNPDVTGIIANACNGKNACSYTVDTKVLGNSALGCIKDFVVVYECNGGPERGVQIPPDASGKIAQLSCN
jgi:hypothetical protein